MGPENFTFLTKASRIPMLLAAPSQYLKHHCSRARKMAQSFKCPLSKHEGLSLTPNTHKINAECGDICLKSQR